MSRPIVSIELDHRRHSRFLKRLARKQLPFATARALTWTAKDAQKHVQQAMTGAMQLRSAYVRRGLRITAARKSDGMHRMQSEVGHLDWFMAQQLSHHKHVRRAKAAEYQYIPRQVRRTKTGRIPKNMKPAQVLKKPNVFMVETGKDRAAIYQKTRPGHLKLLYSAVKSQTIEPALSLEDEVNDVAGRRLQRNWTRSMSLAVRNAKR